MKRTNSSVSERHGVSLALIALLLPVVILLCAFSVNVAQMQLARTELQAATDASARAAGRVFAESRDVNQALTIANQLGELNVVSGDPIMFELSDIDLGISTRADLSSPYNFSSSSSLQNALRLSGRRTSGSPSGPVDYLFPLFTSSGFEASFNAVSTQVELDIAIVIHPVRRLPPPAGPLVIRHHQMRDGWIPLTPPVRSSMHYLFLRSPSKLLW
jgi:Ca-activated chloride channel homolog